MERKIRETIWGLFDCFVLRYYPNSVVNSLIGFRAFDFHPHAHAIEFDAQANLMAISSHELTSYVVYVPNLD